MASTHNYIIVCSGNYSVGISNTWKPGMDKVAQEIESVNKKLEKKGLDQETLEKIKTTVENSLQEVNNNLPHMKALCKNIKQVNEDLLKEVKPYYARALNLQKTLKKQLEIIRNLSSTVQ